VLEARGEAPVFDDDLLAFMLARGALLREGHLIEHLKLGLLVLQHSLLGRDPWFIPSQFRDYIAVLAMVVVLILRPASARPATA